MLVLAGSLALWRQLGSSTACKLKSAVASLASLDSQRGAHGAQCHARSEANDRVTDSVSTNGPVGGNGLREVAPGYGSQVAQPTSRSAKDSSSSVKPARAHDVPRVNLGQQEKHFPGHNSYTPGRSTLTANPSTLANKVGTGQQVGTVEVGLPGSKERVDFGEPIGNYLNSNGIATPTQVGIIHYGKGGIHIVPARPNP